MFEQAVDALVAGDLHTLEGLLRSEPALVRARSSRPHGATLLHYVAANGVEDERQKTPPTIMSIARRLLEAGAEVDAVANMYGDGDTTLNLLVSSVHPYRAGVQVELTELLLDAGAAVDGVQGRSPLMTALLFGYPSAAEVLARRGAKVDGVIAEAGLGRLDAVERLVVDPAVPATDKQQALLLACRLGRAEIALALLAAGVEHGARDNEGFTCLHLASFWGRLDVIDVLLRHGADPEAVNVYGGTVLDTVVWAALNASTGVDYIPVVRRLLEAGSDVAAVSFPSGHAAIDEMLRPRRER